MKTLIAAVLLALVVTPVTGGETVALFDGTHLDHWTCKAGGWTIEDGVLTRHPKAGYIWSVQAFEDFVLELEFKVSKGCNSGLFFRSNPKNPVQGGFEIQILDSHGKDRPGKHDCGALYDALPPAVNAARPAGEWNKTVLTCDGSKIKVELNGKVVIDTDIDAWDTANKNPDGSPNKFRTALKGLPRKGHIGLQDHGKPVWFRNVTLRPLP